MSGSLTDENAELGDFGSSIRTLHGTVHALTVQRGWRGRDLFADDPDKIYNYESKTGDWIKGRIKLEKRDRVQLIRTTEACRSDKLTLTLRPYESLATLAERWDRMEDIWERMETRRRGGEDMQSPDAQRLLQFLSNVRQHFNEQPPTLSIGFHDWTSKYKTGGDWNVEAFVPQDVFAAFADDIVGGRCSGVNIGMELAPTLVDSEYAEHSDPVVFGVLDFDKYGPTDGWTTYLGWSRRKRVKETHGTVGTVVSEERGPVTLDQDLNRGLMELRATVRFGFIAVFVLIALVALF